MNRRRNLGFIAGGPAALMLSACGFQPLYGGGGAVSADMAAIAIPEPDTRLGQLIRNDLISAIRPAGPAGPDRYRLILSPKLNESVSVDTVAGGIQRKRVRLAVSFQLIDSQSGAAVYAGKTFSQASYDETGQSFADSRAQSNAIERVAKDASLDIRTRLAAHFAAG